MRQFALALIVGLLAFSASGVTNILTDEPCAAFELPGDEEGACPPTCVTCGCCAQAAEAVIVVVAASPETTAVHSSLIPPDFPRTDPRDILHVPKRFLS